MSDRLPAVWAPRMLSVLRIMVGLLFLEHGLSKMVGFPTPLGGTMPVLLSFAWFSGAIETVGGLLVAIGLFTRYAAFVCSGEMAVGYFLVHAPRDFFPMHNGGDAAVLFCFIFFYLFVAGGGVWSVDQARR